MTKDSENTFVIFSNWATLNTEEIKTIPLIFNWQIIFILHPPFLSLQVWHWSLKLPISVRKVKGESARQIKHTPDNLGNCFQCHFSSKAYCEVNFHWHAIIEMSWKICFLQWQISFGFPNITSPAVLLIWQSRPCVQNKEHLQTTNKETGMSEMSDDGYVAAKNALIPIQYFYLVLVRYLCSCPPIKKNAPRPSSETMW